MRNNFALLAVLMVTAIGCATADITEPSVCDTQTATFNVPSVPPVPANCASLPAVTIPSVSTTTVMDLSSDLSKIKDVANDVNVVVNGFTIDNSNHYFDWVHEVDVTVSGNNLPTALLAKYVQPVGIITDSLQPEVVMSANDSFKYLNSGPVTVTLTLVNQQVAACQALQAAQELRGMSSIKTSTTMCVSVSGQVSKSL